MANPSSSQVQNLLPVQAYFDAQGNFVTFIGQNKPFYAVPNPYQSGLHITNSTIDSTTIGATTPSTAVFTSGQVNSLPVGSTDIANKQYVDALAAGLSWKQPVAVATLTAITLSGLQVIDGYTTLVGDRVLVKNQGNAADNGIYIAASGAWTRSSDADSWNEFVSAITFVNYGTQKGSAWYCSAQPGGTLGVTAINWSNFSVAGQYFAGTGLNLAAYTFSIANTGVTAASYGSANSVATFTVNAQGQLTAAGSTSIAIANTQVSGLGTMSTQNANSVAITGGSINGTSLGATTAGSAKVTTLDIALGLTLATNAGTAGQVLTSAGAGSVPTWTTPTTGTVTSVTATSPVASTGGTTPVISMPAATASVSGYLTSTDWNTFNNKGSGSVTSVSGTGSVSGITLSGSVTSSGSLILGGSLDLSSPPAIGGTTPAAITGTNIIATAGLYAKTTFGGTYTDGLILDYATPVGQFTVGGSDSFAWRNGGPSTPTTLMTLSTTGVIGTATWGGGVIGLAYGGTNANLTAVAGGAVYSSGSALGITAAGTSGQVLTSNGSSAPTFQTLPATGVTLTDDTTTNSTRYLLFTSATSGTITTENTSSTKLSYNPSTGLLSLISATFAGTTSGYCLKTANIAEITTVSATAATGTINYDVTTQSVLYYTTNASANWTVNFRGLSGTSLNTLMATNDSISVTFMVTQGATAYYNNALTIDGTSVTPKWQGGTAPTSGNASGIDVYNYVITKTASATYTVLASLSQFK